MGAVIDKVGEMYQAGMSMAEIARRNGCSVHKVQWQLEKQEISRRSRSDASYLKHNPDGDPFKFTMPHTLGQAELMGWGLGLYWVKEQRPIQHR